MNLLDSSCLLDFQGFHFLFVICIVVMLYDVKEVVVVEGNGLRYLYTLHRNALGQHA